MDSFTCAVDFVLSNEGGYVNDPHDPGGETNFGISKRAYPNVDIRNLTKDQAIEIYHRDYWLAAGCDKLAPALAVVILDAVVNMGLGVEPKLLGTPPVSLEEVVARRIILYSTYKNFPIYARSWVRRTLAAYKLALTLAGAPANS